MVWAAGTARAARRIATAAALGGGGLTALGATAYGLLIAESLLARKTIGRPHGLDGPPADGDYGDYPGTPIKLAMLGDSISIGLGMTDAAKTPAVMLAHGLAAVAERPVRLCVVGKSGAPSAELDEQVDAALAMEPDVAVLFVGANDVITATSPATAVRHLSKAVRRLREAGAEVIVGTCPDLGTVRPLAQPLRWVARRWSRQIAAAQTVAVVDAGGRTVAFADLLGPEFHTNPGEDVRTGSFPSICPRLRTGRLRGATFGVRCVGVVARAATRARRRTATDLPRGGDSRGGARHRGVRDPGRRADQRHPRKVGDVVPPAARGGAQRRLKPVTLRAGAVTRVPQFGVDCPCSGLSRNRLSHSPGPWPWPAVPTATQPPPPIRPGTTPRSTPSAGWLRPAEW